MSQKSSSSLFRYRLILRLLAPAILCFNAWQAICARDTRLFWHRLGLGLPRSENAPLWLHAASVGELIAARPLVMALRERFPHIPIVVTTTTPTGAKLAAERLPAEVQHFYMPMDWPGATRRFSHAIQPRAALIMETELWPNLFMRIARENIPLVIINGRLSERTLNTRRWIKRLYATCLQSVAAILARSEHDASAFIQLGASADKVQTIGNIKFALPPDKKNIPAIDLGCSYILAASTHEDEERQLATIWKQLDHRDHLLVIAPRHPNRRDSILQQLRPLSLNISVRSNKDAIHDSTDIYLADTLGELESLMVGAALVFMGGSLVARGGHNILEPARLGKPILFGPYMYNFQQESELLLAEGAAQQVTDTTQLQEVLELALARPESVKQLGYRARHVMDTHGEVLTHYIEAIVRHCNLPSPRQTD